MDTQPIQPPILPTPPPPPQEKSPQGIFIVLALILIIGAVFAYKYFKLKQSVAPIQPSPTPIVSPESSPEINDPTADWLSYENMIQNYSLKYPSDWKLNETGASVDINNKLTLAKDNYFIAIYSNIQGVGGTNKQVPSTPITVAGLNLFKRDIGDNLYTNTGSLEISATDSTPTFKYQDKTYEIYLTYPLEEKGTEAYLENLATFDLILSTFKFTKAMTEEEAISLIKASYPEVREIQQTGGAFNSSSDIKTKKEVTLWKLVFNQGSGDCPSGCINNQYWYFTVDNDKNIIKVGEYERIFVPETNSYTETGSPLWNFLD